MPIHGYPGNVITANPTAPTVSSASGVWTTEQQLIAMAAGNWPMALNPISQSLRFNSADTAYLSRTPATAGNRRTWTWSGWVKRCNSATTNSLFSAYVDANNFFLIQFRENADNGRFEVFNYSSAFDWRVETNALLRDPSAWYHIVVALDTTQATDSNRIKIYVNGTLQTLATTSYPTLNFQSDANNNIAHYIGQDGASARYHNGYLTEVTFVDGLALTPASFGQTNSNTGVWEPRQYTGSFGTNGFYLQFNKEGLEVESLIVAGGGGGGVVGGGGGGAGGYRTSTTTVALGVAYTITVGAGGTAGTSLNGGNGSNSVFSSITSTGGGGGGGDTRFSSGAAKSGGSGGGGGGGNWGTEAAGAGNTPSTSPSQGNNGGTGSASSPNYGGAGGGGAGATGGNGSGTTGGTGAAGTASSITGSSVTRAGGGGGGTYNGGTAGNGGSGGGGNGGIYLTPGAGSAATNGTANTGGGGGGGGISGGSAQSGGGGSGVVIIKIADTRTATFSGGVTQTSTTSGGFKIYTVTATSTTSETVTFS